MPDAIVPVALLLVALATAIRAVPVLLSTHGAGVDHWFWKKYVETYRKHRIFPPVLDQYVLDEGQWYPPLFPLLLSTLPDRVFEALSRYVSVCIDLCRLILLIAVAYLLTEGQLQVVVVAAVVYATIPIQTSYNIQLNPRSLGALFLDLLLVLLLWLYNLEGPAWAWLAVLLLGALILLTHKMTTQLFWFMMLGLSVIYRRWELLALIPGSIVVALMLSRGFYWKVLRAHWDIVSFWNRNWRWIGADLLRESPIYGDGTYERPQKLHRAGLKGRWWQLSILFGFNPAAWIACLLVYERLFLQSPLLIYPTDLLVYLLLPCMFAFMTTFVPALKCLGAGYLYVYNTSFMSALLLGLTFRYTMAPEISTPFVLVAVLLNVAGLAIYLVRFYRDRRARVDSGLTAMLTALKHEPRGVVMCVPPSWCEVVTYTTPHSVLWGAHGYGFRRLEPTWPRLLVPFGEVLNRYGVRYLLTMDGMLPDTFVADLPPARVVTHAEYQLYCFGESGARPPLQVQ